MTVARVLPDVRGIDKTFDYVVPDKLVDHVRVGSLVRIDLHGRRVGGARAKSSRVLALAT